MTVKELSKKANISVRTLQYYDKIGLLTPARTENGYRTYSEKDILKLEQIMLFRELEFSLDDIKKIITAPNYCREAAIENQIELLKLKKNRIENLIIYANEIKKKGEREMDFSAFNKDKLNEYEKKAKEQWGETCEYAEYKQKAKNRTEKQTADIAGKLMKLFAELGELKNLNPQETAVQEKVKEIKDFITDNYYNCTDEIFLSLGSMYNDGGEFTKNIDNAGGVGTAEFAEKAIKVFCNIS